MNKMFAVSHINWGDYELTTIFVEAADWRFAAMMHPKIQEGFCLVQPTEGEDGDYPVLPTNQKDAKQEAFDQDMMINIVEVPDSCDDPA